METYVFIAYCEVIILGIMFVVTFQISGVEVEVADAFIAPSSYSYVGQEGLSMEAQDSHLVDIQTVSHNNV